MDYLIKPDVTVGLAGVRTGTGLPAAARGDLLQVDHPFGPGAEHQAKLLAFTFLTLLS